MSASLARAQASRRSPGAPVPASWLPGSWLVRQVSHGGLPYFPRPKCSCDLKAFLEAVPSLAFCFPLLDCEVFPKLCADMEIGPHFCWLSLQPLWEPLTIVPYSTGVPTLGLQPGRRHPEPLQADAREQNSESRPSSSLGTANWDTHLKR